MREDTGGKRQGARSKGRKQKGTSKGTTQNNSWEKTTSMNCTPWPRKGRGERVTNNNGCLLKEKIERRKKRGSFHDAGGKSFLQGGKKKGDM